jgi:hypothetical protein
MNGTADTKVCPHCAETIKSAAKVCPHCRFWQKKWSLSNPQVAVALWTILCLTFVVCVGFLFEKTFGPKNEFATYRDEILVVDSQFSTRASGSNLYVTVVGTLTNKSNIGWKEIGVEAQFQDKSGKLIDANTDEYRGAVMLPHGNTAFKIEGKAARSESDYGKYTVSVRWAKDVDAMF